MLNSQCFILALGTTLGLVLSVKLPQIGYMEICALRGCAPFDPDRNYKINEKWIDTVIYNMGWDKVFQLFDSLKKNQEV